MEKLETRAVIKNFCNKWKEYHSNSTVKKWAAEFKRVRESVEDDRLSGRPKIATTDENVEVLHTLVMYDRRPDLQSIAIEVGIRFLGGSTISPYQHLRYVKDFGKMGGTNVDP